MFAHRARRLLRTSSSSDMTKILSKNKSTGSRMETSASTTDLTEAPFSLIMLEALMYASFKFFSMSDSNSFSSTVVVDIRSPLERIKRYGLPWTSNAVAKSSPSASLTSSLRASSTFDGLSPCSAITARTRSTRMPRSRSDDSRRLTTNSTTASLVLSSTRMGWTSDSTSTPCLMFRGNPRFIRMDTSPTAVLLRAKTSAFVVGAHPAANNPTKESSLSATASAHPAVLSGRLSVTDRGNTASKIASATSSLSSFCRA
mmetsp:Transcript_9239/g.27815  ORF Transcript_9239/g.27815 Transcript_9239/m.27815 type:complete len:258 (+) Transcript_9239:950-1723(+)